MRTPVLVLTSIVLLGGYSAPVSAAIRAHEWGTFTSLVGSDGETVHGMYHEDEVLPSFVHGFGVVATEATPTQAPTPTPDYSGGRPCRGKSCFESEFYDQNLITQKMETPVIYFYTDQPQENVSVNVKFPEGILTETYPAPVTAYPPRSGNPSLMNGEMNFELKVTQSTVGKIPFVDRANIYSHARNVESHIVSSRYPYRYEAEKFLFYRGLGRFYPEIQVRSQGGGLRIDSDQGSIPNAMFLVDVDQAGSVRMLRMNPYRSQISDQTIRDLRNHQASTAPSSVMRGRLEVRQAMIAALDQAGLNLDEAVAMINTWEHGYLRVPGLRILYILPRQEVDRILPLTITPRPIELERVFVGRLEVLLDTDEAEILFDILMQEDQFDVRTLGRFAEPKLRRVQEAYRQREIAAGRTPEKLVVRLLDRLILTAAHSTSM